MGRDENGRATEEGDEGAGPRERRGPGIFFWIAMACLAVVVTSGVADGDLLLVGTYSALGLFLILQRTGLRERSATWRWAYNACAVAFSLLALLILLRNFGFL